MKSLVEGSLYINGWYDSLYEHNKGKEKLKKVLKKVGLFDVAKKTYNLLNKRNQEEGPKTEVYLSGGEGFAEKTKIYMGKILFSGLESNIDKVVTNNAFEPFLPQKSLEFFHDACAVIVDRDPRDIYASIVNAKEMFVPDFEKDNKLCDAGYLQQLKEDMLGTADVQSFIKRQGLYRSKMNFDKKKKNIIYINYEDLVMNYGKTIQKIFTKVGVDPRQHIKKKQYFNPAQSEVNVGAWKRIGDSNEIKLIEKELKEYLYTI